MSRVSRHGLKVTILLCRMLVSKPSCRISSGWARCEPLGGPTALVIYPVSAASHFCGHWAGPGPGFLARYATGPSHLGDQSDTPALANHPRSLGKTGRSAQYPLASTRHTFRRRHARRARCITSHIWSPLRPPLWSPKIIAVIKAGPSSRSPRRDHQPGQSLCRDCSFNPWKPAEESCDCNEWHVQAVSEGEDKSSQTYRANHSGIPQPLAKPTRSTTATRCKMMN